MCTRARCPKCGKPTWAGCGRHVELALAGVPLDERCRCAETSERDAPQDEKARRKRFGLF